MKGHWLPEKAVQPNHVLEKPTEKAVLPVEAHHSQYQNDDFNTICAQNIYTDTET